MHARKSEKRNEGRRVRLLLRLGAALWFAILAGGTAADSCIDCHGKPELRVTDVKLFDYFQDWSMSVHSQEGVGCSDCHGGDPSAGDMQAAHRTSRGEDLGSETNYRRIPETCGQCHSEIHDAYLSSAHYRKLMAANDGQPGPNCVTCHGSLNVAALNVATVHDACVDCHNEASANRPEVPHRAEELLGHYLSIHRLYRYISVKGDPARFKELASELSGQVGDLAREWHHFDLDRIEEHTERLLERLREERRRARIYYLQRKAAGE